MAGSCFAWHSLTGPVMLHSLHLACVLLITDTPATPVNKPPQAEGHSAEMDRKAFTLAPAGPLGR